MIKDALRLAGLRFREAGLENPALEGTTLLGYVVGESRTGLYRNWLQELPPELESRFFSLVERRIKGEPAAYLTGEKEFMGLSFAVNPAVLIPRPETEALVEQAEAYLTGKKALAIDVGCGSGAIGVSLAVRLPQIEVYAVDLSAPALETARHNARRHGVGQRMVFRQGDLLEAVAEDGLVGRVDLIAANLPYIATGELFELAPDVRDYEPRQALVAGATGLELYQRLIPQAARFLKPGGRLLMEIGCTQRQGLAALLPDKQWRTSFRQDLAGRDRLAIAELRSDN
jgi:release factor glutamine methyltransferase